MQLKFQFFFLIALFFGTVLSQDSCVPCTSGDVGCTHPEEADQQWCDDRCSDGVNSEECDVAYCNCGGSLIVQNPGKCMYPGCGCAPFPEDSWCDDDSFTPGWCSESESNCNDCSGDWCSETEAVMDPVTVRVWIDIELASREDCKPTADRILQIFVEKLGASVLSMESVWSGFCAPGAGSERRLLQQAEGGSSTLEVTTETTDPATATTEMTSSSTNEQIVSETAASSSSSSTTNTNKMAVENVLKRSLPRATPWLKFIEDTSGFDSYANVINVKKHVKDAAAFDDLFPYKNDAYTYQQFINAVAYFPDFCSDSGSCAEELAVTFAHFTQETGMNDDELMKDGESVPTWKQGLNAIMESGCEPNADPYEDKCGSYEKTSNEIDQYFPPTSGKDYFGRGAKQLSWNSNYGYVSIALTGSKDTFLDNPDLVLEPKYIISTAMWFYMTPQNPKPSMHDIVTQNWVPSSNDKALKRLVNDPAQRLARTIEIINGEQECWPLVGTRTKPEAAKKRFEYFVEFGKALNVDGVDDNLDYVDCGEATKFDDADNVPAGGELPLFYYKNQAYGDLMCGCNFVGWMTPYMRSLDMLEECESGLTKPQWLINLEGTTSEERTDEKIETICAVEGDATAAPYYQCKEVAKLQTPSCDMCDWEMTIWRKEIDQLFGIVVPPLHYKETCDTYFAIVDLLNNIMSIINDVISIFG